METKPRYSPLAASLAEDRELEAHFLVGYIAGALEGIHRKPHVIASATPIREARQRALLHVLTTLGHDFEIEIRSLEVRR